MRLVIITGLSGSGKTTVIHALEDIGFFCIDNLPVLLLPGLVALLQQPEKTIDHVAVVMDVRERTFFEEYPRVFQELRETGVELEILFLEADTAALLRRFEETRRPHPLAGERPLLEPVEAERERLAGLRQAADEWIDTSTFNIHELRRRVVRLFEERKEARSLQLELHSFSFRKGIPSHADMILDVRFLPNPHYERALRDRDGRDPEVQRYVRGNAEANEIVDRFASLLESMVAFHAKEDRAYFVVAIGCTGGKHRSVATVCRLEARLRALGYRPVVRHRDLAPPGGGSSTTGGKGEETD